MHHSHLVHRIELLYLSHAGDIFYARFRCDLQGAEPWIPKRSMIVEAPALPTKSNAGLDGQTGHTED